MTDLEIVEERLGNIENALQELGRKIDDVRNDLERSIDSVRSDLSTLEHKVNYS